MTAILRNRRFLVLVVCCAAVLAVAAGCGGSSSSNGVPKGDVALVAGVPITKAQFDLALDEYNRSAVAAGQKATKCCGADYQTLVQQKLMPYLVQRTEFEQGAKKLGAVVTSQDIDKAVAKIITQDFKGKRSEFLAAIKKQGSNLDEFRDTVIMIQLLEEKVTAKLTAGIKVTDAEALAFYNKNKSQYEKPKSRDLSHILVKTKAQAEKIYNQLKKGASFATLAKKYSTDKGSGINGGKLGTAPCSGYVKPFAQVACSMPTGTISKPVHSQYGWHIIKANGPIIPASTTPFSKEKAAIVQQLLQAKRNNATATWQTKLERFYAGKVKYASAYAPPQATSPGATTLFPTTSGG
jgi:foldase protein PrsA